MSHHQGAHQQQQQHPLTLALALALIGGNQQGNKNNRKLRHQHIKSLKPPITLTQHRHSIGAYNTITNSQQRKIGTIFGTAISKKHSTFLALTLLTLATLFLVMHTTLVTAIVLNTHIPNTTLPFAQLITISKSTYSAYLQAHNNNAQHTLMGNRQQQSKGKQTGYNLAHWNKGNANFHNKLHDVLHIINTHNPHIFSISEANIHTNIDTSTYQLNNYSIETTSMAQITGISRQALLIKNNINYTRRHDLENNLTSTIWVEIHTPNKKSILVMGGYRQWQLQRTHPQQLNSHTSTQQQARWQIILTQWTLALQENKHTIVLMDDNIDTIHNNTHNTRYSIQQLKTAFLAHTQDHGTFIENTKPTRHMFNTTPSCIDHITTNCPTLMHNTTTHITGASDHCILTTTYSTKHKTQQPSYIKTRDKDLLTKHSMTQFITHSTQLQHLFTQTTSDTVADTLMMELNLMINCIAPARTIQTTKKHAPYLDTEALAQIQQRQQQYRQAQLTNSQDDWRQYRHIRNTTTRLLNKLKTTYYTNKFTNKNNKPTEMWGTLKNITNNNDQTTPKTIIHNNNYITSPRAIANTANHHYINKITNIRSTFKRLTLNPISILSTLIPRQQHTLIIPPITLTQTLEIITKASPSHSTGHDDVSMHIIKQIKHTIAPHITHLINTIISTNTFPDTFKLSRITPIKKPKKSKTQIDSFRPINNLCTLDKIVEQHIKLHLDTFLTKHNIIQPNHHGGRRKHSTTTALAQIYNTLHTQHEKGLLTATLQTDLSAAFDTVDTKILLAKLEHYGVRDNTLALFTSYLTQRTQFVEVDTFRSDTLKSPQCSVIQGSKLSGTLYTLYTNEIPLLHKLMGSIHFDFITQTPHQQHNNISHTTVNFVDDSTNVISSHDPQQLTLYLTQFYTLLHAFYTINKLKINADKTELLLTCKQHLRHLATTVTMHAHNHTITQKQTTKILGAIINNTLTHKDHINTVISSIHYKMHTMRHITQYTTLKTRLMIANAIILSTLNHLLPLLINAHKQQLQQLQTLLLKSTRLVIGSPCFKWSTSRMLKACNWHTIYHMITIQSTIFIHNIIAHKTPSAIYNMLTSTMHNTQGNRFARKIRMSHRALTDQLNNSLIYKAISIYNTLPTSLMSLDSAAFKLEVKKHIISTQRPDCIPARIT